MLSDAGSLALWTSVAIGEMRPTRHPVLVRGIDGLDDAHGPLMSTTCQESKSSFGLAGLDHVRTICSLAFFNVTVTAPAAESLITESQ
jgi:hypothetical protein